METKDKQINRRALESSPSARIALILVAIVSFTTATAFAQEMSEPEVLLKDTHNSALFELDNKFSKVDGGFAHFIGFSGGWLINRQFLIGLGGYGMTNRASRFQMGYGGLVLEYFVDPSRLLNFSVRGLIGGGASSWAWEEPFFVAEPEVKATLNITERVRLGFGGGYRFVRGVWGASDRLSGPVVSLDLTFEVF